MKRNRRILLEELSQEDQEVEAINGLLLQGNLASEDHAYLFLSSMTHLLDHPDLMIYGAHDDDGEVMPLGGRSFLTKEEAMSFSEFGGEKVNLVSDEYTQDSQHPRRWFEYEYIE